MTFKDLIDDTGKSKSGYEQASILRRNKPNAMTCSTSGLTLAALTSQTMPSFHERAMPYFGGTAGSNSIESWSS